ncbi:MAG: HypC/HybG/HupF family hydrogenase formation chaperone, partial [Acidimicrobiales bacterium]
GRADDRTISEVMRRSEAWGLTTVWIGAGPRPPSGSARHVVWVDDPAGTAAHDGTLVLQYHLLWEMTHICFDHPGALAEPTDECTDDICITCSYEGVVAEVEASTPDGLVAVRTGRGRETIDATLVGPVDVGDLLLVHAGSAITRLEVP